jgi:hypothetical protein
MTVATTSHATTEAEALLKSLPKGASFSTSGSGFSANCYEPDDVVCGTFCMGRGDTLEQAIAGMLLKVEEAKRHGKLLRTPKEVKEAVIGLIREHDAAPASFRAAIDDLRVSER